MMLTGKAKILKARASGVAHVDATDMSTDAVWVTTKNSAWVGVTPKVDLKAFARDQSEINYTRLPKNILTKATSESNVLLLEDRWK